MLFRSDMLRRGFKAKRGTLTFVHGKYYISIPFAKKASKRRENTRIAAADLGLKTFATISVFDKTTEIDRKFLDQKGLCGKKENWFKAKDMLSTLSTLNTLDLKGRLFNHRFEVRKQQSIRNSNRKNSVKHWFARNVEKGKWRKIKNLHVELIDRKSVV